MLLFKVGNVFTDMEGELSPELYRRLQRNMSFRPKGYEFSTMYNRWIKDSDGRPVRRMWDGWRRQIWKSKDRKRIYFPTGLFSIVRDFLGKENLNYNSIDCRVKPLRSLDLQLNPELIIRDYQDEIVTNAVKLQRGIIQVATAGGKCINEDSVVLTDEGMLTFQDLSQGLTEESSRPLKLTVCAPLLSSGRDVTTDIYCDGTKKSIKIRTVSGFSVCGTPNHRIKILNSEGNFAWKQLDDIKIHDICVITKNQNIFGNNSTLTEDDGYWIGLLIGDGCLTQRGTIILTNEDQHIISFAKKYCKKAGLKLHDRKHTTSEKCRNLFIHNVEYRKILLGYGCDFVTSLKKEIPKTVRQSPKKVVAAFIRGLYETDGWVENKPAICLATSSPVLANQVQVALLNFGIVATKRVKKTQCNDSYTITVYSRYVNKFLKEIGLDKNGHKYNKLKSYEEKPHNDNISLTPNQSSRIRKLKNCIQEEIGFFNTTKEFSKSGISYRTINSWIQGGRLPSSSNLYKFASWAEQYIYDDYVSQLVHDLKYYSGFHYEKVKTKTKKMSKNFDFVIPKSESFVAQGFINHNTYIAAAIIQRLGLKSFIFFVTSIDLLTQAKENLEYALQLNGEPITVGQIGGGVVDIRAINVMTVQTAVRAAGKKWDSTYKFDTDDTDDKTPLEQRKTDIHRLLKTAEGAQADECQHWKAETCQLVARSLESAYYTYALSATPYRDEGDDLMIQACFGKKIAQISASQLIRDKWLIKPNIKIVHVHGPKSAFKQWQQLYKDQVTENDEYNKTVASIANSYIESGRLVLVLVQQIKHGKSLSSMIPGSIFLSGASSKKKRAENINKLRNKEISCITSTVIFDEGIDVRPLDTLILAGGGKSKVRAMQRIGRILRPFPGKTVATAIDFRIHQKYLFEHSVAREKMYRTEEEFDIEEIDPGE